MSIIIQNIDPNPRGIGEHLYVLRINQQEITRFTHKREEGLTKCLQLAAAAAKEAEWSEVRNILAMLETIDADVHSL